MLKQLIQRLLDSRTTPAQAGHASKPGSAVPVDYNPSASVDNWGPVLSNSTAVSDGYIWAVGRTTSDKGFFQINTQALQITTTGTSNPGGEILNLFTPVSKGQRFSVYGRYLEQITVRLVKTIGGGGQSLKNALLQGGGLCLKTWYSSLRRSSCRVRDRGFNTQSARVLMQWPLVLQPTASGTNSHPAWTGMSRTVETPQSLFWKFPAAVLGSLTPKHLREGTSSLYREVKSLVTSFQQIQQCRFYTLSPCEEKTNFAVGGASC